jgi:hypothetical protein
MPEVTLPVLEAMRNLLLPVVTGLTVATIFPVTYW